MRRNQTARVGKSRNRRTFRQRPLRSAILSACLGVSALAMTGAAVASKDPERMPASAGQTEYDRTANTRVDVWERVKESASEEPRSLNDLDTEIGGQTIGISEDDSARATDLYERLVQDKENTEFGAFLEDLDYYDEVLEDPEGDYTKLAPRISRLENMDYNWEPAGVSYSSWKLISVTELGSWEPAIGTQTTNFTQTRNRLLDYQRLVEKEERNIATQEVRVASSTYESDPRTDTISRDIEVNITPWAKAGDNTEERTINYVVASTKHLVDTRKETRDASECRYDILESEAKFAPSNTPGQIPYLLARSNIRSHHRSAIVFVDRSKELNKLSPDSSGSWYPKQPNDTMYIGEVYWAGNDSYQPGALNVWIGKEQQRMFDIVISDALYYSGGLFLEEWLTTLSSATTKESQLKAFSPPTKANPLIGADGYKYWAGKLMATPSWSKTTQNFKGTLKAEIYEVCRSKN